MAITNTMGGSLDMCRGLLRLNALIHRIRRRRSNCGKCVSTVRDRFNHIREDFGMKRPFAVDTFDPNVHSVGDRVALGWFASKSSLRHFPEVHLLLGAELRFRVDDSAADPRIVGSDLPLSWMEMGSRMQGRQSQTAGHQKGGSYQDVNRGSHWRLC